MLPFYRRKNCASIFAAWIYIGDRGVKSTSWSAGFSYASGFFCVVLWVRAKHQGKGQLSSKTKPSLAGSGGVQLNQTRPSYSKTLPAAARRWAEGREGTASAWLGGLGRGGSWHPRVRGHPEMPWSPGQEQQSQLPLPEPRIGLALQESLRHLLWLVSFFHGMSSHP